MILQIGFNKCGTRTIHHFFSLNGLKSIHYLDGSIAKEIEECSKQGRNLLGKYESYDVITDMEYITFTKHFEGYKEFKTFAHQYPGAIFILNTRDREKWIKSRARHSKGYYLAKYRSILGASSDDEVFEFWRKDWDDHLENVRNFFKSMPERLIEFNIEQDGPDLLVSRLPMLKLDASLYKHVGRSGPA
jgi:hypothetical protein